MEPQTDNVGETEGDQGSLDDSVGQAMDEVMDQGGSPTGDPETHIEPAVGGGQGDFASDETDESTSGEDQSDPGGG